MLKGCLLVIVSVLYLHQAAPVCKMNSVCCLVVLYVFRYCSCVWSVDDCPIIAHVHGMKCGWLCYIIALVYQGKYGWLCPIIAPVYKVKYGWLCPIIAPVCNVRSRCCAISIMWYIITSCSALFFLLLLSVLPAVRTGMTLSSVSGWGDGSRSVMMIARPLTGLLQTPK